jgi:zeaxanthin epoxidase
MRAARLAIATRSSFVEPLVHRPVREMELEAHGVRDIELGKSCPAHAGSGVDAVLASLLASARAGGAPAAVAAWLAGEKPPLRALAVLPELSARVVEAKRTGSSELPSLHELLVALQTETAQAYTRLCAEHPHAAASVNSDALMSFDPLAEALRSGVQSFVPPSVRRSRVPGMTAPTTDAITAEKPLRVLIAGAGVGGLVLANALETSGSHVSYTVLERTKEFKKFGGPIQLASNAMQGLLDLDADLYKDIEAHATFTGDRTNGIKDGLRDEWYAKFDLRTPASIRKMPYTCVVDRPDLQDALLKRVGHNLRNAAGISTYRTNADGTVTAVLDDGEEVVGDVLIGADGIWSKVRQTMRNAESDRDGATYSGYTVFAGELDYGYKDPEDPNSIGGDPECGYKVYIGPQQYFVITDIGNGRYQWYAFLSRPEGSEASEPKPAGVSPYLQDLFTGWSPECLDILRATQEHEIEQRDLFDRPPSVLQPWTDGPVALLGDAVHAMMPNLGQGGCQALEDARVLSEKLTAATARHEVPALLQEYRNRRLARSAAVQGLSRIASDIIIKGFDTPAKVVFKDGKLAAENFNYAGIVTRLLQPILPIFFSVQFNFLYSGWKNEPLALEPIRDFFLLAPAVLTAGSLALDVVGGAELGEGITTFLARDEVMDATVQADSVFAQFASFFTNLFG